MNQKKRTPLSDIHALQLIYTVGPFILVPTLTAFTCSLLSVRIASHCLLYVVYTVHCTCNHKLRNVYFVFCSFFSFLFFCCVLFVASHKSQKNRSCANNCFRRGRERAIHLVSDRKSAHCRWLNSHS